MSKEMLHELAVASVRVDSPTKFPVVNRLIEALPAADRARLIGSCTMVQLVLGNVLYEPGTRLRHAYFPLTGFISLLSGADPQTQVELGLVGDEGMFGVSLVLGVAEPHQHADGARPCTCRHILHNPSFSLAHARRASGWRHQGGRRVTEAESDSLHTRPSDGHRPTWPGGRRLQLP